MGQWADQQLCHKNIWNHEESDLEYNQFYILDNAKQLLGQQLRENVPVATWYLIFLQQQKMPHEPKLGCRSSGTLHDNLPYNPKLDPKFALFPNK